MARPRAFDPDAVTRAAMMTFWRHGYEGTTTRMLEEATGVGIRSLFNTFGDKAQLFETVLNTYFEMVRGGVAMQFATPGLAAIETFFEALQTDEPPESIAHAGCLMVNTVFELEKTNPKIRAQVERYRAMWKEIFQTSLETDGVTDAEARAEFLVGALWGALSQIELTGQKRSAAPLAQVVVSTVQTWRPG